MKHGPDITKNFILLVVCALMTLALAACENLNLFQGEGMAGPNYKPLSEEIAALSAPPPANTLMLYCRAGQGTAKFRQGWIDFQTTDFTLTENQRAYIDIAPVKGSGKFSFQGIFDRAGQKLIFCPIVDGPPDQRIACASLYALDDDLAAGIRRTFDVPNAVIGAEISCAKSESALKTLDPGSIK